MLGIDHVDPNPEQLQEVASLGEGHRRQGDRCRLGELLEHVGQVSGDLLVSLLRVYPDLLLLEGPPLGKEGRLLPVDHRLGIAIQLAGQELPQSSIALSEGPANRLQPLGPAGGLRRLRGLLTGNLGQQGIGMVQEGGHVVPD